MFGRVSAFLPALGFHQSSPPGPLATPFARCHRVTPLLTCTHQRSSLHNAARAPYLAARLAPSPLVSPLTAQILQTPSANSFSHTNFPKTPRGWGGASSANAPGSAPAVRQNSLADANSFALTFFCTLLHFFVVCKKSSPAFSVTSTLFAQNTRGGIPLPPGRGLRLLAMSQPFNLPTFQPPNGLVPGHCSLATRHVLPRNTGQGTRVTSP